MELGPLEETVLPPFGADGAAEVSLAMFDKVMTRLVDLKNEIVEVGGGGKNERKRGRVWGKDFFRSGSSGFSLKDGETTENVEPELARIAPLDLIGNGKLAAEGKVAGDSVSTDVEDPADEGGPSSRGLGAGLMRLDLIDEGGGRRGVGEENVEDGVDFTPQVAVGALLEGVAFEGRVGKVALDNVARVNPKDTHELSWSKLKEGKEAKGFGPGD